MGSALSSTSSTHGNMRCSLIYLDSAEDPKKRKVKGVGENTSSARTVCGTLRGREGETRALSPRVAGVRGIQKGVGRGREEGTGGRGRGGVCLQLLVGSSYYKSVHASRVSIERIIGTRGVVLYT